MELGGTIATTIMISHPCPPGMAQRSVSTPDSLPRCKPSSNAFSLAYRDSRWLEGLGISWPSRTVSVVHLKTLVLRCDHHRLEHLCFSAILLTIHGMIPPLSLLATLPLHRPHNSLGHRQRAPASHVFAPIGNAAYSRRPGVPASSFDVTLMPGEHFTAIRDPPPPTVYFTGDTSYRPMPFSTDDGPEILPVCPAFKDFALHVADPQRHRRKTCAQDALQRAETQ
ncbi:hypothetical protein FB451DRAFT_1402963 [Mycena latifolia]|nr:hypothetical protein FB451DRAFT_1402963 [Mycena latifolia]